MKALIKATFLNRINALFNKPTIGYVGDEVGHEPSRTIGIILDILTNGELVVDMGDALGIWQAQDCKLIID